MHRTLKSAFAAGACAGLLLVSAAQAARPLVAPKPHLEAGAGQSAEALVQPGTLKIAKALGDDVAGQLVTPSGAMSFRTQSLSAAGKRSVAGTSPDRVQARLEINGAVIDHEIDYAAGTLTVSTENGVVIDARDRAVLRTFQNELGRDLLMQGSAKSTPKSLDLLWRLSEMYSEVPLGHRLKQTWVIRRSDARPLLPGATLPAVRNDLPALTGAIPQKASCNEQGGGSFINLHSIADVCLNGRVYYRSSAHDYCPAHGYTSKSVAYGCGSNSCAGRCGAGCGAADGLGAWYQDCLDHDVCNRDHNSQLGGCGDEWTEAADDYAFGAISCYTTCH